MFNLADVYHGVIHFLFGHDWNDTFSVNNLGALEQNCRYCQKYRHREELGGEWKLGRHPRKESDHDQNA